MKNFKKIITSLLVILMVFSILPLNVFASENINEDINNDKKIYKVEFVVYDEVISSFDAEEGSSVTPLDESLIKANDGEEFVCFVDSEGNELNEDDLISINSNMTYYAKFIKIEEEKSDKESSLSKDIQSEKKTKVVKSNKAELKNTELEKNEFLLDEGNISINKIQVVQGEEKYTYNKKEPITIKSKEASNNNIIVSDFSGEIILDNINMNNTFYIENGSSVTLTLKGDNIINGVSNHAGIEVSRNDDFVNEVTIKGNGTLNVSGGSGSAGIGGNIANPNGIVNIVSGTINATAGNNGAGIGGGSNTGSGGSYKIYKCDGGDINILGGKVTAKGNGSGAAIGGGNHGDGGNITISGDADVTATGGAAGIGSGLGSHKQDSDGKKGPGYYNGGNIVIKGNPTVKATGGNNSAGIGGGMYADSGNITISGGNITAYSPRGNSGSYHHGAAAIGGGYVGHGNVNITGGTINAYLDGDNSAAAIGSGATASTNPERKLEARGLEATYKKTTVNISGGNVTAKAGKHGAGIGGGYGVDYVDVDISAGYVYATGSLSSLSEKRGGAGIGSGSNNSEIKSSKYAFETTLNINITGGSILSVGGFGASGIGSGSDNKTANEIKILNVSDLHAYSDGTKFAVDTEKGSIERNGFSEKVLQGTFTLPYTSKSVKIYEDKSNDKNDLLNIIREKEVSREFTLPDEYRSFAVDVDNEGNYLVFDNENNLYGVNSVVNEKKEDNIFSEENKFEFSYNVIESKLSDNYYLYPLSGFTILDKVDYIVHYVDTNNNPLHEDKIVSASYGEKVTEKAIDIKGYKPINEESQSIKLDSSNNEITFVYDKILYEYTVYYVDKDNVRLYEDKIGSGKYNETVSEKAININGYKLISEDNKSIVIDTENNTIVFVYEKETKDDEPITPVNPVHPVNPNNPSNTNDNPVIPQNTDTQSENRNAVTVSSTSDNDTPVIRDNNNNVSNTTINDGVTPLSDGGVVNIEENETPLSEGMSGASWALINLLCTLFSVLSSLVLLVFTRKKREEYYDMEDNNTDIYLKEKKKMRMATKVIALIDAVVALVVFILTEDMTLPMALVDKWTILMIVFALVSVVSLVMGYKNAKDEASEEEVIGA